MKHKNAISIAEYLIAFLKLEIAVKLNALFPQRLYKLSLENRDVVLNSKQTFKHKSSDSFDIKRSRTNFKLPNVGFDSDAPN